MSYELDLRFCEKLPSPKYKGFHVMFASRLAYGKGYEPLHTTLHSAGIVHKHKVPDTGVILTGHIRDDY